MELLNIRDVVERDTIGIFGKAYEILGVEDLGPYEHAIVNRGHELSARLAKVKKPTAAQERQIDKALGDVIRVIIPSLTAPVLKRLERAQRANIVFAWIGRAMQLAEESKTATNPPTRRTGAASSRASKPSTAATRKPGSTRRRGS